MKKLVIGLLITCMFLSLAPALTSAAGSPSGAPDAYKALHELSDNKKLQAQYIFDNVVSLVPEVSNDPVTAEHEDGGITMWFDHSYYNTPAEEITSNGKNTYQITLAKNETEGCHLLIASDRDMSGLTLSVSKFKNADGKKLDKEVCYGWYFDDVDGKTVVDPIPVLEHEFDLTKNKSQMFIIKVKSKADSPAGQYSATVKLKDSGGNVIKQANVYAYVWDFTLPVASYCKTLTDLNEWSVIVGANREGTTQDGLEDDLYALYYEYLLDNKVNCYNLPYAKRGWFWSNEVEKYLDDPRCTAYALFWKYDPNYALDKTTHKYIPDILQSTYDRVSKKQEWLDKAYFYPYFNKDYNGDEPLSVAALENIKMWNAQFTEYFGAHKLITPIHYDTAINNTYDFFKYLEDDVTVWCPKTYFFNTSKDKAAYSSLYNDFYQKAMEDKYGVFIDRMAEQQAGGDEVWWYVTRFPHNPEITFSINDESVKHRILFWQSKLYNIDGVLYYMCNDWENAKTWTKKYEHAVNGTVVDTYGNGVLIYPGGALQEYIDKYGSDGYPGPIGSLRLESIRDGVEDYDDFTLLDQKYGEGTSDLMIKQITTALGDYSTDTEKFAKVRETVGNLLASENVIDIPYEMTHEWGEAEYVWSADNKTLTASHKCVLNAEHGGETETVNVTAEVVKKATYKAGGKITYTSEAFTKKGFETQTKTVQFNRLGDINGDKKVNNKDVTVLFRALSDPDQEFDRITADCDGDGDINNKDTVTLFKYVSGCDIALKHGT